MHVSQAMILDSTRSVCPVCFREIPASIIENNGRVFFSCVAGAESQGALQSLFEDVGFVEVAAIDASQVIVDLYESLKRQSFLLEPLLKIVGGSCGCVDLKNMEEFGRTAEQLILEGKLGYSVLIGKKPFRASGVKK